MLRHERLQLPCQLGIPTRVQILLDPLLEAGEVEILQTRDLGLGETAVGEVGERRAPPEGERLRRPAALLQLAKALQIELVPHDAQQIAGRPRLQPLLADQLAQPRDVHLKSLRCGLRRVVLPEGVDQPIPRDDVVRVEEQHREQGALLGTAEIDGLPIGMHLQRAEDPELHSPPGLCRRESATLAARGRLRLSAP